MSKFLKMTCVIADNAHIVKLMNAVKAMISKQKQQMTAFMRANTYIITFKFEAVTTAAESSSVCEILICLAREIIIRCFNTTSENHI